MQRLQRIKLGNQFYVGAYRIINNYFHPLPNYYDGHFDI